MKRFIAKVNGNHAETAKENGYNAYYSNQTDITTIEVRANDKQEVRNVLKSMGLTAVFISEQ